MITPTGIDTGRFGAADAATAYVGSVGGEATDAIDAIDSGDSGDSDRLMALWATPPDDDAAALAGLRALYTDPMQINGSSITALDLLVRIRAMQRAYSGLRHELVDRVDASGKLVIAFRLRGTHTGPLATLFGELAPTGRAFEVRVIDILTLTDGRISEVTMVADELGQLAALGALTLR